MSETTETETRIRPGQKWTSRGGTVWTVEERRGRIGYVEVLIVSASGAKRRVSEADLRSDYTLAESV